MAKNYGTSVSAFLEPEGRNYETAVYQASKPVLDSELNFVQDLNQSLGKHLSRTPSGWIVPEALKSSAASTGIFTSSAVLNEYKFPALAAVVNGWPLTVAYTGEASGLNLVDLGAGPAGATAKRTDLVVLEVWRRLLSASPSTVGKSSAGRIWRNGNVKVPAADDLTLNYADDILDANVGAETTKRVQIQYRLRVIQGVDLGSHPLGLSDPTAVAYSVPASAASPDGVATLFTYANQSAAGDAGLWVAGDGNPANTLGTVDGYMYAIPVAAVFRRNTTAWDRDTNMNGGVASPTPSDRPDGLWHNIVDAKDLLDLRSAIHPDGWNYEEVLAKNVGYLFDNQLQTEYTLTGLAGGIMGATPLVADEIGPNDNPGAALIGNFDGVRRRFSDRPIVELVWLQYQPADGTGPGPNWQTPADTVTIDPSALPIVGVGTVNWSSLAPADANFVGIYKTQFVSTTGPTVNAYGHAQGIGDTPQTSVPFVITNTTGLTNETLYVGLLVQYPAGSGLSKTPTAFHSVEVEDALDLPADFQAMEDEDLDFPHRELRISYVSTSTTYAGTCPLVFDVPSVWIPDHIKTIHSVDIDGVPYGGVINVPDRGQPLLLPGLSGGELVEVDYDAIRAFPGAGEQFTVYYDYRAPQTVLDGLLGSSLPLIPRYIPPYLYVLGSGSSGLTEAYPYPYAYVQAGGVYPSASESYDGDHQMTYSSNIEITGFKSQTGFLRVPVTLPFASQPEQLELTRSPGDVDIEGRSFFPSTSNTYHHPSAYGTDVLTQRHRTLLPLLCEVTSDQSWAKAGTLVLVTVSRYAVFDGGSFVGFDPTLADNTTSASVFSLKGRPLNGRA